jgi:hypothetical protein
VSHAVSEAGHAASSTGLPLVRQMFSFPVALGFLLAVLAELTIRLRFDDPDMWWHLKTGEIIWSTHTIPTTDLFSYTTQHHAYVPHEWLAQWFIYGAYRWGGYPGLMLWFCCMASALLVAGYGLCSLYARNVKIGFLGALTIWLFATSGLAIRPQVIGYLLLIVELLLIHLGRNRSRRWFFALPPLFALWVNCHGSFFLGLVVAGVILASSFVSFEAGSLVSAKWAPEVRSTFAVSLALCVVALFCNPVGIRQVLYPLNTLLSQPTVVSQITEWQPLQFNESRAFALLGVLACTALVAISRSAELRLDELLMLAIGVWLAASHQRLIFVFGILAAPVLSRMLTAFWDGYDPRRDRPVPNAVLIAASLAIAVWAFPRQGELEKQVGEASPVRAVEFIKTKHLAGPMLNEFVYGGYLIWALPEQPVFVDGRADVFDWTGVFKELTEWETLQVNPHVMLDKYGIRFCLLSRTSPMVTVMSLLEDWEIAYSDHNAVIFIRKQRNASLLSFPKPLTRPNYTIGTTMEPI